MANANITQENLVLDNIPLLQNGQRADAEHLNAPIIALRDNQLKQKNALLEISNILDSGDLDLDELSEIATKIKTNTDSSVAMAIALG